MAKIPTSLYSTRVMPQATFSAQVPAVNPAAGAEMLARQQQQSGEELRRFGVELMEFSQRRAVSQAQEQYLAAETQMQDKLYGEDGLLSRKGKNALDISEEYAKAYKQVYDTTLKEIAQPEVRQRLTQQLGEMRNAQLRQVMNYQRQEERTYNISLAETQQSLSQQSAMNLGMYSRGGVSADTRKQLEQGIGKAVSSAVNVAIMTGAPEETVQLVTKEAASKIYRNFISGMATGEEDYAALVRSHSFMEEVKDKLMPEDVLALQKYYDTELPAAKGALWAREIFRKTRGVLLDSEMEKVVGMLPSNQQDAALRALKKGNAQRKVQQSQQAADFLRQVEGTDLRGGMTEDQRRQAENGGFYAEAKSYYRRGGGSDQTMLDALYAADSDALRRIDLSGPTYIFGLSSADRQTISQLQQRAADPMYAMWHKNAEEQIKAALSAFDQGKGTNEKLSAEAKAFATAQVFRRLFSKTGGVENLARQGEIGAAVNDVLSMAKPGRWFGSTPVFGSPSGAYKAQRELEQYYGSFNPSGILNRASPEPESSGGDGVSLSGLLSGAMLLTEAEARGVLPEVGEHFKVRDELKTLVQSPGSVPELYSGGTSQWFY